MEDLVIFSSVACSSLLFFSVPVIFFVVMRRIRRKEQFDFQLFQCGVFGGAELGDGAEHGQALVAEFEDCGDGGADVGACFGVICKEGCGGVEFGDAALGCAFGAQAQHGMVGDFGPVFDHVPKHRVAQHVEHAAALSYAEHAEHFLRRFIHAGEAPEAVDSDARVGGMAVQSSVDGAADGGHGGFVPVTGCVAGDEAHGGQHLVAGGQRDRQGFAQEDDHVAAGAGASGFEERDVAGADVGLECEVELAEASGLAPLAQLVGKLCHGTRLEEELALVTYL